jgi:hypothetical protein
MKMDDRARTTLWVIGVIGLMICGYLLLLAILSIF